MTWMQTSNDRKHDLLAPALTPIDWEEIAHALSQINRFTGHTDFAYSVAQHCCLVADMLPEKYQLHGLLHDAYEAYTGDVSTPMQFALGVEARAAIKAIQAAHDAHIFMAAGIAPSANSHAAVKHADRVLLMTERRDLMGPAPEPWADESIEPLPARIRPWSPEKAKDQWLLRLRTLTGQQ